MKRYAILVVQYGSKNETELCQVDENPHAIAEAAANKRLRVDGGTRTVLIPKYDSVRVIELAGANSPEER
jgi:hypothetical protein